MSEMQFIGIKPEETKPARLVGIHYENSNPEEHHPTICDPDHRLATEWQIVGMRPVSDTLVFENRELAKEVYAAILGVYTLGKAAKAAEVRNILNIPS